MDELIQLARRLRGLRDSLDLSLEEMASDCGVTSETLQKYESGEHDIPVSFLQRLSHKKGVELTALLFGEEPKMSNYYITRKGKGAPSRLFLSGSCIRIPPAQYGAVSCDYLPRSHCGNNTFAQHTRRTGVQLCAWGWTGDHDRKKDYCASCRRQRDVWLDGASYASCHRRQRR